MMVALFFAVLSFYGFSNSKPIGSPFYDTTGASWLPPLLNRDHEPAYARHDFLPVGPKDQLFHRARLEKWGTQDQPIKNLLKTPGAFPWRISTEEGSDLSDIIVDRLFLSADRRHLGAIGVEGKVFFYQNEKWEQTDTLQRGEVASVSLANQFPNRQTSATGAAFSPDGTRFLTYSDLGPTQVWDVQSGSRLTALQSHTGGDQHAEFSPDGTRILTVSRDNTAAVSDSETGDELVLFKGHGSTVLDATFDPTGQRVATASEDGTARIWDSETGNELAVLESLSGRVTKVQFFTDGEKLLTSSEDNTIRIWDSTNGEQLGILRAGKLPLGKVTLSNDGRHILTSHDSTAVLWDAVTGRELSILSHQAPVSFAGFSPDGSSVLTTSADGRITIWNTETGRTSRQLSGIRNAFFGAAFSPDNRFIASAYEGGILGIWSVSTGERLASIEGLDWNEETLQLEQGTLAVGRYLTSLTFSGNGTKILAFSSNGEIFIFDVTYANDQSIQPTALDAAARLLFSPDRLQWIDNGTPVNISSFFPVTINATTELGENGMRVAVGDEGAIYLGIPASPGSRPQSTAADVPETQANAASVGIASEIDWLEVKAPQTGTASLRAVYFDGSTGITVGDEGSVLVSHDGGFQWTAGTIGEDHAPALSDVRIDRARNYAVAVGRPTFDGAPSHGVLYKTVSLPEPGQEGIGEWKHVPWAAGAPVFSYVSIVLCLSALLVCFYYLRKWWIIRGNRSQPIAAGKSDREIGWEDEDVLGLQQLANQVSLFLRNTQTEPPLVLGVAGGWGSGKSSFMNLLWQELKQRGTSAVWFNAWHHQNEEHLLAALFEAVRTRAIPSIWSWRGLYFRTRLIAPRLQAQFMTMFPVALLAALAVVLVAFAITDEQVLWLQQKFKEFEGTLSTEDGLTFRGIVVTAVPVAGLIYWLRTLWIALPAKPAKLLKNFSSLARITDFQDKLSFRYNFGKAFGEVCRALRMPGVPGLVIFIDDLDRCQASSVLSIFEAVNYFMSVGDCIVVMGFDRAQVEHSIGEELKHIADGIPDREIPFHFEKGDTTKRRAYARHYMEKLINLEITIPPMTPEAAAALVQGRPVEVQEPSASNQRWLTKLKPAISLGYRGALIALQYSCIGALLWAFWIYGGGLYERIAARPEPQAEELLPVAAVPIETGGETLRTSLQTEEGAPGTRQNLEQPTATEVFENQELDGIEPSPGPIEPVWRYEELWILVPLVLLLALAAVWIYLRRAYSIAKNVTYDPETFTTALKDANKVIEGINGTPRAIKRFMNRMRFASARMREINYTVDFLDLLASWFGWISRDFEHKAESSPQIDDAKVIALGSAEAFLQGFPDPEKIDSDPRKMIDDYLQKHQPDASIKAVASEVKGLLDSANVGKEHTRIYARKLHSSATATSQEGQQPAPGSNQTADPASGVSRQPAK
ncbi:P-loop NTPase fold protein [Labrenzia sp. OB1]|uniref:P-loop NTPase fold protein n=1 Tax=Labrenzia sp. OB1 TaxID=1561204 RepID=UPI0007B279A9|nr:P-loop NTPase fold protein [Labrenzia sp. OB1]KZM48991.1 hypothetical protein OA90_17550 [Labrenzia sp. OB1]